ncbi:MAG: helix-turn-helix transcriptional regulator [Clostridia bacterium]|nr:helix-turn-helix transcriptional regulator [Clostridia bacterium]
MSRTKQTVLEYRTYDLPADFPLFVLSGENWRISPIPSKRLHIHNCLEIGLCHSDSGSMILGEQEVPFSKDDVTFIARNVPHTTWSSPGTYSLWSYLYVDVEALLGSYGMGQIPDLNAFYRMMTTCRFILPTQQYPWAMPIVRAILTEYSQKQPGYKTSIRGLMLHLVICLLRIDANDGQAMLEKNLSAIGPALEYMRRHFDQTFAMDYLADLCHISPTHFRRLFSAQMGVSPLHFLHQLRVMKSCRLLRTTDQTIAEIATQVGYSSLCCFNQHFKRFMGSTPSEWRKSSGENKPSLITYTGWLQAEEPDEDPLPPQR